MSSTVKLDMFCQFSRKRCIAHPTFENTKISEAVTDIPQADVKLAERKLERV